MKNDTLILSVIMMLLANNALAEGVTAIYGLGGNACGDWSSTEPTATEYRDWLLGYLSGLAASRPRDILKQTSPNAAIAWVKNYCKAHPLDGLAVAATALMKELVARASKSN